MNLHSSQTISRLPTAILLFRPHKFTLPQNRLPVNAFRFYAKDLKPLCTGRRSCFITVLCHTVRCFGTAVFTTLAFDWSDVRFSFSASYAGFWNSNHVLRDAVPLVPICTKGNPISFPTDGGGLSSLRYAQARRANLYRLLRRSRLCFFRF